MSMKMPGKMMLLVLVLLIWLHPVASPAGEDYALEATGHIAGFVASGNRMLDNEGGVAGPTAAVQARFRTPAELSLYFDGRYLGDSSGPETGLREAYIDGDAGKLHVRAGRQIIVWGRADRFNPTDVITPRNYEILAFDDDDQRFGADGAQAAYAVTEAYSITALVLPSFRSSRIPSDALPAGISVNSGSGRSSPSDAQWGIKLDRTGETLDWSVSYFKGFSTLPELALRNDAGLVLDNRGLRMIGADFAASLGAWGVRGEAAYVDFEEQRALPELYPHSYLSAVLGVERVLGQSLALNVQWLHRRIQDFTDPRTIPGPLGLIAMGNALIHDQFDKKQEGVTLSIRDTWFHDTLQAELSGIYFFSRRDYLVKPQMRYALSDRWSALLLADLYQGPEDSFLGGLKKNSLAYAELRYQFGPARWSK
jgi:hypothetical protein